MPDIDNLSIQIKATTDKANSAIDNLIDKLGDLSDALGGLSVTDFSSQLEKVSNGIGQLNNAVSSLDSGRIKAAASGLNSFSNAVGKLGDVKSLDSVANGLGKLASVQVPDLSGLSGLGSAVGSVAKADIALSVSNLGRMVTPLKRLSGISIPEGLADYLSALGTGLSKLGGKKITESVAGLGEIAKGIQKIASIKIDESSANEVAQLVNAISKFGYKSASQAIVNIPKVADGFAKLVDKLNSLPKVDQNIVQLADSMATLARFSRNANGDIRGFVPSFNLFSGAARKTSISIKSLASVIGKLYANFWILRRAFNAFRDAGNLASDLTEVNNVVLQAFGAQNTAKVDAWAKGLVKSFGLSELAAKEAASRYQAMGVAMGFSQNQMTEMSLALVERAADIGSLYNKEFTDVAKDMNAVFTGMVAPMRKYGVDMTQASLKAYAMARGMDSNIKSMTQMQKTMLRYQYVLEGTTLAQDDFARTADSFANSLKILRTYVQALGTVIGQVFIGLFRPVIRSINNAMNTILGLVEKTVNAIGKLMGWQIEVTPTAVEFDDDVAEALADSEEGAGGTADALEKANENAKELKKTILGFDQLNILQRNKDSDSKNGSGAGGGGSSLADAVGANSGKVSGAEMLKKAYESDIESWFELGRKISDTLSEMMEKINWNKIYEKARNFGTNLASFLNGLITPRLFGNVGATIAGALNTALHFLDSFGMEFNWKNFGNSIAAGVNRFFGTFDFALLAHTINVWAKGLLDTVITFIEATDWKQIGTKIGEFLVNLDFWGIALKVGRALWDALNAAVEVFASMFATAPFETAFLGIVALGGMLLPGFINIFKAIVNEAANVLIRGLVGNFETLLAKIMGIGKAVLGVVAYFGEFLVVENIVKNLSDTVMAGADTWKTWAGSIAGIATAIGAVGAIGSAIFGFPGGLIAAGVVALVGAFVGLKRSIDGAISDAFQERLNNFLAATEGAGHTLDDFSGAMNDAVSTVTAGMSEIQEQFDKLDDVKSDVQDAVISIQGIGTAIKMSGESTQSEVDGMMSAFEDLSSSLTSYIDQYYDAIAQQLILDMNYLDSQGKLTDEMKQEYAERITEIYKEKDAARESTDEMIEAVRDASAKYSEATDVFGRDSAEAKEALENVIDTELKLNDLTKQYGITVGNEVDPVIGNAIETLGRLKGGLDLSAESYENVDDFTKRWNETQAELDDALNDGIYTIEDYYQNVRDNVDATRLTQQEYDNEMDRINYAEQVRIEDLKTAYSELSSQLTQEASDTVSELKRQEELASEDARENMGTLQRIFFDAGNKIKDFFANLHIGMPKIDANISTDISYDNPSGYIPGYASGGFPEDGLFFANHGEMVGRFSNGKTAVANNSEITEGIRQAVVQGMMDVYMATSSSNTEQSSGDVILMVDSEEIARASIRGQRSLDKRFNPTIQFS